MREPGSSGRHGCGQARYDVEMKTIFMMTDLEGVAGVTTFYEQTDASGRGYDRACRLLTGEINAAVEGLLSEGVEQVYVCDGHGPGAVWFEDLHPAAQVIHGRPIVRSQLFGMVPDCDAAMILGQHAMAGVATSNMNHTQSSRSIDGVSLNGKPIGEIAQFALYCGAYGVPVFCLTGERDACLEAQDVVPGIHTVETKIGLGRGCAISPSAQVSRGRLRTGVAEAVSKHRSQPVPPLVWEGPFELTTRYFHTSEADARANLPGYERVDGQTVRFRGDRVQDVVYRV